MNLQNDVNEDDHGQIIIQPFQRDYSGLVEKILDENLQIISSKGQYDRVQLKLLERILSEEILSDSADILLKHGDVLAAGNLILSKEVINKGRLVPGGRISELHKISYEGNNHAFELLRYIEKKAMSKGIQLLHTLTLPLENYIEFFECNNYVRETITNYPGFRNLPVMKMRKFL